MTGMIIAGILLTMLVLGFVAGYGIASWRLEPDRDEQQDDADA